MCLAETCRVTQLLTSRRAGVLSARGPATVSLITLDEPVEPGAWLLVHAGFALAVLTDDEALDAIRLRAATEKGIR